MAFMAIPVAVGQTMALPGVSVACVREAPGHAAELGTQVLMGMPLRILGAADGWVKVETPEGYTGYVIANSLETPTDKAFEAWRSSERVVVTAADQTYVYASPEVSAANRVMLSMAPYCRWPMPAQWKRNSLKSKCLSDVKVTYSEAKSCRSVNSGRQGATSSV